MPRRTVARGAFVAGAADAGAADAGVEAWVVATGAVVAGGAAVGAAADGLAVLEPQAATARAPATRMLRVRFVIACIRLVLRMNERTERSLDGDRVDR
jgi:hypothetical protein